MSKIEGHIELGTQVAASAPNNSIFRDVADNLIKTKDNSGTVAEVGGGGGGQQIHSNTLWVDNGSTTNYIGWSRTKIGHEMDYDTGINFTSGSMVSFASWTLVNPHGVAVADQTVDKFILTLTTNTDVFKNVSIVKVRATNWGLSTYDYTTILYEGTLTVVDQERGLYEVPAVSFSTTSITKGDLIYIFFGASGMSDFRGSFALNTTLD